MITPSAQAFFEENFKKTPGMNARRQRQAKPHPICQNQSRALNAETGTINMAHWYKT